VFTDCDAWFHHKGSELNYVGNRRLEFRLVMQKAKKTLLSNRECENINQSFRNLEAQNESRTIGLNSYKLS